MRSGNIAGAVVPDEIGNLDCTDSQTLLVSFIEPLERDCGTVCRRRQELKGGASGPSFMKGMVRL
jgi:hypothetical protein